MDDNKPYDYSSAGFDSFLSRSIDNLIQANLDSPGPTNSAVAFDRTQVSGSLGDTLTIGDIHLNGAAENIIMSDGQNDRLLIGRQDGGF